MQNYYSNWTNQDQHNAYAKNFYKPVIYRKFPTFSLFRMFNENKFLAEKLDDVHNRPPAEKSSDVHNIPKNLLSSFEGQMLQKGFNKI
jgi:hypothetical protein